MTIAQGNLNIPRQEVVRNTPNGARDAAQNGQPKGERGPHGRKWFLTVNNPSIDITRKLEANMVTLDPKLNFIAYCEEHRGPIPEQLKGCHNAKAPYGPATWTRHYHIYCEFKSEQRMTAFKNLLEIKKDQGAQMELARFKWSPQIDNYMSKGDYLRVKDYPDLPIQYHDYKVNDKAIFSNGLFEVPQPPGGGAASHAQSAATAKEKLTQALEKYQSADQFCLAEIHLYARHRNGIIDYYNAKLRLQPSGIPLIEWHFGDTRSGKTFTAYELTGGRDNPECYYHSGTLDWIGHYGNQRMMLMNEYAISTMQAFKTLLQIMEGYPGEYPIKGGFTSIRLDKLIITCPRPPKALEVEFWGKKVAFRGEFEKQERYGNKEHAQGEMVPFENVEQVTERILESGGRIVGHARKPRMDDIGNHMRDEKGRLLYIYTSVEVAGQGAQIDQQFDGNMDEMLDEIQPFE